MELHGVSPVHRTAAETRQHPTLLQSGHLISLHEGKTENLLFARGSEKSSIP